MKKKGRVNSIHTLSRYVKRYVKHGCYGSVKVNSKVSAFAKALVVTQIKGGGGRGGNYPLKLQQVIYVQIVALGCRKS